VVGRPDSRSFTRLLVSVGGILCVLAVLGPGWVLRDTGTLRVTQGELNRLTPESRAAMIHRQHIAANLGEWALWIGLAVLLVGISFLVWGAWRLRKQEEVEQELATARKDFAKQRLSHRTEEDVGRERKADVADQLRDAPDVASATPGEIRALAVDRFRKAAKTEKQVLERLRGIADARRAEYNEYPSFHASDGTTRGFDALSTIEKQTQFLVQVKTALRAEAVLGGETVPSLYDLLIAWDATFSVGARGWLIVVADTITREDRSSANRAAAIDEGLSVTLLTPTEVDGLELPEDDE
jgi:hypothetical protein